MDISIIVAMDLNGIIGYQDNLLWHLPKDLKRFKELTLHHPIIMGRKTHEAIGRTLPKRTNIVISRNSEYKPFPESYLKNSLQEAIDFAKQQDQQEIFIIGGEKIYKQTISTIANKMYITKVLHSFKVGDKFFPTINLNQWQLIEKRKTKDIDKINSKIINIIFEIYKR